MFKLKIFLFLIILVLFGSCSKERSKESFIKEKSLWMRQQGDQNVITDLITKYYGEKIKTYPDEWTFSYKWTSRKHQKFSESVRTYEQVPGASIAVFHGKPDPHESTQKWVIDSWK